MERRFEEAWLEKETKEHYKLYCEWQASHRGKQIVTNKSRPFATQISRFENKLAMAKLTS
jgi:hypothetical protein